ncbi:MAG TPA: hypothetical protein VD815_07175 [Candidatus Saccharimonadales bacterium]|nr:hypothetical protein [Candidatus Saccharimonadales bacterium]
MNVFLGVGYESITCSHGFMLKMFVINIDAINNSIRGHRICLEVK